MFAVVVAAATTLASGYFVVTGILDPAALVPGGDAAAARTFAGYLAARGAVLLGALLWFAARRDWRGLGLVLALNGAVQVIDTALGLVRGDLANTLGPACFAAALFAAAIWLRAGRTPGRVPDRGPAHA